MLSSKYNRMLKLLLIIFVIITALKILFTGYDIDEQYAISMAYRMIKGDTMLAQMWEPHQTSGFLAALFMLPFLFITKSTTGIVLYLRFCGLILHAGVSFLLYRDLKKRYQVTSASLITCIFFFTLPKLMFLPEFSNMQIWFLILMILCFLRYYVNSNSEKGALFYLVLAGILISLEVLSYPSTIFVFFICCFYIIKYRSGKSLWKELVAFISPCIISAFIFITALLQFISFSELLSSLSIISSDGSHAFTLTSKLTQTASSFLEILLYFIIYAVITTFCYYIVRKRIGIPMLWFWILLMVTLIGQVIIWIFGSSYPNYPLVEYFFIVALGIYGCFYYRPKKDYWFSFFIVVPFVAFAGIIIFTNHPLLVSSPFLIPCVVGILTARKTFKLSAPKLVLYAWVIVLLFGKCYMLRTTGGEHYTVFDEMSLIRKGPAMGIVANTPMVHSYYDMYDLVYDTLPKEAKVFYAGTSTGIYLLNDIEICTPSTISSPTFDEKVEQYFDLHPTKRPDYVVVDYNLPDYNSNSWLKEWMNMNCSPNPIAANDYFIIYSAK